MNKKNKETIVKEISLNINSYDKMINLGIIIGSLAFPGMIIAMNGDLGAGKTTLTKGIGKSLHITETINSPTFTIMKVYNGLLTLYHLDVYRILNSQSDFELEEYFYLDGVSVIEWADNIKDLLPDDLIKLSIEIISDDTRKVVLSTSNVDWYNRFYEKVAKIDDYISN